MYRDDKRIEDFQRLVRRLAEDYDIITTADFLDLYRQGKIVTTHTVDVAAAEMPSVVRSRVSKNKMRRTARVAKDVRFGD